MLFKYLHWRERQRWYVRLHLDLAFGQIKVSAITTEMIDCLIEQKQAASYANATINRWLEALRRVYRHGDCVLPPYVYSAPKIEMLDEDNVREGFLEHEQYLVFRSALPDHQQLILVVGYHLGMRRGEILRLRWDQVDCRESCASGSKWRTQPGRTLFVHRFLKGRGD